jgi:hypothetical protein
MTDAEMDAQLDPYLRALSEKILNAMAKDWQIDKYVVLPPSGAPVLPVPESGTPTVKKPAEVKITKGDASQDWMKWFGIGLSLTSDLGNHTRVKSAHTEPRTFRQRDGTTVMKNVVIVDEDHDIFARPILEAHYFFFPYGKESARHFLGLPTGDYAWGIGPFVMIALGGDNLISAAGGGLMVGFRQLDKDGQLLPSHYNIGVAYTLDFDTQVLADGYREGLPTPNNSSEVKYRTTSQGGISVAFSIAW